MAHRRSRLIVLLAGLVIAALSLAALERARWGIETRQFAAGETPVTLYGSGDGPLVVVAHGFAGSRQLMQAFSYTLARAGYRVAAFDFEGHGRNPVPMSGDVTSVDGTTARLVEETGRVIAAARDQTGHAGPVALVGHSMATDILVRAARGRNVAAIVNVSMYSDAVTAAFPDRLLMVTGQFEPPLRAEALEALRQVAPNAREGETVRSDDVVRRAVVAPWVEHVGVLYSPTTLRETRDWLDAAFGRDGDAPIARIGLPLLGLMAGLVALVWPFAGLVPQAPRPATPSRRTFLLALALPGLAAPLASGLIALDLLPVLIADALALHLLVMGGLQLAILARAGLWPPMRGWGGLALLLVWGLGVLGLALDRYAASFLPIPERLPVIALLAVGTLPYMLADAILTEAGRARAWRRLAARLALFLSLGVAIALDPERLLFVATILPVLILFFLVHGLMGRWVGQHAGPVAPGLALGLILAWALGVTFPMFRA